MDWVLPAGPGNRRGAAIVSIAPVGFGGIDSELAARGRTLTGAKWAGVAAGSGDVGGGWTGITVAAGWW